MTNEADGSVVLAELEVALLRKCNKSVTEPMDLTFSCSVLHGLITKLCQNISHCLPTCLNSSVVCCQLRFLLFSAATAVSTFSQKTRAQLFKASLA